MMQILKEIIFGGAFILVGSGMILLFLIALYSMFNIFNDNDDAA